MKPMMETPTEREVHPGKILGVKANSDGSALKIPSLPGMGWTLGMF